MTGISPEVVVVLAAGLGSRLRSAGGPPKPLLPLAGRPLILRVLDRFAEAGTREAIAVLGHRGDEVRRGIEGGSSPMPVSFVENPRWELRNGLSAVAAREAIGGRAFFLSMSDHIFEAGLVAGLAAAGVPEGGLALGVDRKLDRVFDMDDATKVRTSGGLIVEIGKDLEEFDAVDTGLFACSTGLLDALAEVSAGRADGDCSLSEGVGALASRGLAAAHDVGDGLWQDVDTPGAAAHAEELFFPET